MRIDQKDPGEDWSLKFIHCGNQVVVERSPLTKETVLVHPVVEQPRCSCEWRSTEQCVNVPSVLSDFDERVEASRVADPRVGSECDSGISFVLQLLADGLERVEVVRIRLILSSSLSIESWVYSSGVPV